MRLSDTAVLGPVTFTLLVLLVAFVTIISAAPANRGCTAGAPWQYAYVESADGVQAGTPIIAGPTEFQGKPMCHATHTIRVDGAEVSYDLYFSEQPLDVWAVIGGNEYHLTDNLVL